MTKGAAQVAQTFDAALEVGANYADEVYPGYAGLVVANGKARLMSWGFPLVLKGRQGQPLKPKPVTNARDDKLLTGFWLPSFKTRRCVIPVSAWAEPEGQARQMTRTWYSLPDQDVFAVAGLWRPTDEWGDVYTMVMTQSCAQMVEEHDRMPVLLTRENWRDWTQGTANAALDLCRTSELALSVERTGDRWIGGPGVDRGGAGGGDERRDDADHPLLPGLF